MIPVRAGPVRVTDAGPVAKTQSPGAFWISDADLPFSTPDRREPIPASPLWKGSKEGDHILIAGSGMLKVSDSGQFSIWTVRSGDSVLPEMRVPLLSGPLWSLRREKSGAVRSDAVPVNSISTTRTAGIRVEQREGDASLTVEFTANPDGWFDLSVTAAADTDVFIPELTLPGPAEFPIEGLRRFFYPRGLGLYIQQGFFKEHRQFAGQKSSMYPSLFSDFVRIENAGGAAAIYTIQDGDAIQPAALEITGENEFGVYSHTLPVFLPGGRAVHLPVIRIDLRSGPLENVYTSYAEANHLLSDAGRLTKKIPADIFDTFAKSVMMKVDLWNTDGFSQVEKFLPDLPVHALVHLVSFWPKAFDQYYPDYLPPEPKFGTMADLHHLNEAIRRSGRLRMPYTNPTWWNASPTMDRLGPDIVAIRKRTGEPIVEWYGPNSGWVISPWLSEVRKRRDLTVTDFVSTLPSDFLFEDQIGAREFQIDWNPRAPGPLSYLSGIRQIVRDDASRVALMTEGAWDMIAPYEAGFCIGLSPIEHPSQVGGFNLIFGVDNWGYYPAALFWANSRTRMYPHNLAPSSFFRTLYQLSWSMVFSHGLVMEATPEKMETEREWRDVAEEFSARVGAVTVGQDLKRFEETPDGWTLADYGRALAVGNFREGSSRTFGGWSIGQYGFLFEIPKQHLMAGAVDGAGGIRFPRHQLFILEQTSANELSLYLPKLFGPVRMFRSPLVGRDIQPDDTLRGVVYQNGPVWLVSAQFPETSTWRLASEASVASPLSINALEPTVCPGEDVHVDVSTRNGPREIQLVLNRVSALGVFDPASGANSPAVQQTVNGHQQIAIGIPADVRPGDYVLMDVRANGRDVKHLFWRVSPAVEWRFSAAAEGSDRVRYGVHVLNHRRDKRNGVVRLWRIDDGARENLPSQIITADVDTELFLTGEIPTAGSASTTRDHTVSLSGEIQFGSDTYGLEPAQLTLKAPIRQLDFSGMNTWTAGTPISGDINIVSGTAAALDGTITVSLRDSRQSELWTRAFPVSLAGYARKSIPLLIDRQLDPGLHSLVLSLSSPAVSAHRAEPLAVFAPGHAVRLQADVDDDGDTDEILANDAFEAVWYHALGGRLMDFFLRKTRRSQLYRAYPAVPRTFGDKLWAEYGGSSDWFPSGWPGKVWNNTWSYRVIEETPDRVVMEAKTDVEGGLKLSREIVVRAGAAAMEVNYRVENVGASAAKYAWAAHPDAAPGGQAGPEDEVVSDTWEMTYRGDLTKNQTAGGAGWAEARDKKTGEFLRMEFPADRAEWVGMWHGKNFFTIEPIFKETALDPGASDRFTIRYLAGVVP